MKKLKTLAIVFALAAMVFHLGTTAQAASEGSITIKDTQADYTYNVYKILDLTASEDYSNVIYTIDEDWVDFFMSGAGADYLIPLADATAEEKAALNRITYDGEVYYLDITSSKEDVTDEETGNVPSFATDALAYVVSEGLTPDGTATGDGNDVTIEGLDLGYYLVYPYGASIQTGNSDGSLGSLVSTLPDAEVVIKATDPTIEKTADDYSVELGQVITFTADGKTVPDTTGYTSYTYEVVDSMSEGLTFDGLESITVMFGNTDITEDINIVTSGTTHTNTVYDKNGEVVGYTTSNISRATAPYMTLLYDGTTRNASVIGFLLYIDMTAYQTYVGEEIVITYTATTNENAVAVISTNDIQLRYSNDPFDDSSFGYDEDDEDVYSARVIIDKYDGDDNEKLEGATFVLYKVVNGQNLYYALTTDNEVTWVSDVNNATPMTTDADGAAQFDGLEDGTYYLEETEAPDGYNVLEDPVEVVISGLVSGTVVESALTYTESIENYSGTALPSTGGIGTTIFYVIGGVLILGAVVLLSTRRLMGHQA